MKTFRFRDFPVYGESLLFRKKIVAVTQAFPMEEKYRLIDKIHRACLSIILNIAEGSAKKSDPDFARFLEMAIASTNEVVAALDIAVGDGLITEEVRVSLENDAEMLAKQLGGFLKKLRSSQITVSRELYIVTCYLFNHAD